MNQTALTYHLYKQLEPGDNLRGNAKRYPPTAQSEKKRLLKIEREEIGEVEHNRKIEAEKQWQELLYNQQAQDADSKKQDEYVERKNL